MARKIKVVAVQPVHDADGNLIANVGDEVDPAGLPPGVTRLVIVEDTPKSAKAEIADQGSASGSFGVAKTGKAGKP